MPSRKNNRHNQKTHVDNPQKFNWKQHKVFNTYEEAKAAKNTNLEGEAKYVKIKRCGPDGVNFKVKIGIPIEKNKSKNKKSKKEKKDA